MKLATNKEVAEILKISTRTLKRDVVKGLPVEKTEQGKGGGKPHPLFNIDDVKNWYLENKPGSKTSLYILQNCPPAEIKTERKARDKKAKIESSKIKAEAKQTERAADNLIAANASGDDLIAMKSRLINMEKLIYQKFIDYSNEEGASPALCEKLEQSYTRIANRRQSFEKELPKIMEEKGKYSATDKVAKVVTRAWLSFCSHSDQVGHKIAESLVGKNAIEIKALIDTEMSASRRAMQKELKGFIE